VVERGLRVDKDARFETTQAWLRALEEAAPDRRQRRADELVTGALGEFVARLISRWQRVTRALGEFAARLISRWRKK
jgi:hypothetical protein